MGRVRAGAVRPVHIDTIVPLCAAGVGPYVPPVVGHVFRAFRHMCCRPATPRHFTAPALPGSQTSNKAERSPKARRDLPIPVRPRRTEQTCPCDSGRSGASSPVPGGAIVAAVAVQFVLQALALWDVRRRPADEMHAASSTAS